MIFIQPKLKGDPSMRKFLSIFIALAMALSLFAGVGAHSAKAAATLTVTSAGNFSGGVDGVGTTAVNAVGTVVSSALNSAVVNVTIAGVGTFDPATPNVSIMKSFPLTATSTDADWATPGNQYITFSAGTLPIVGDEVYVTATGASAVGTVLLTATTESTGLTTDQVNVTTAYAGTLTGAVSAMRLTSAGFTTLRSIDLNWQTVGAAQPITFTGMGSGTLAVGDRLEVSMVQLQAAIPAYAFLVLGGTVSSGDVAAATWQDTTGTSHTASYTLVAGDTLASVTTKLTAAINTVVGGLVTAAASGTSAIKLTQTVAGTVGNGKTLTGSTTATDTSLTIHTLGGLTSPAYAEEGKTIQLVAVNATGAIVAPVWTLTGTAATISTDGLVMAMTDSGVTLVTATSGSLSGMFVVVNVPTQTITSLAVKLVPAALKVAGKQQFGAIAASAGYSALDYTTQAAWTDTLPVGVISNAAPTQGLLTYGAAETGNVSAYAGSLTSAVAVTVNASGVVTITTAPVTVKKVIVLTIGTDIVTVDGKATSVDAAPELVSSRTFVPIRFIAETFGSTVTWAAQTKSVTIVLGATTIGLQIGNKTAAINGKAIALEAAPYIKNSRTMVPLRVISESFGGDVVWDAALRTITITYTVPAV
jgi:hypothetical protein